MNYLKHLLAVNKEKLIQVEALVIKYEAFRHLNLKRRTRRNHEEIYIVDDKEITYANQRMTSTVEGIVNYRFFVLLESILSANIRMLTRVVEGYQSVEPCEVLTRLPRTYRIMTKEIRAFTNAQDAEEWKAKLLRLKDKYPPGNPEHLTQPTCHEGVYVRSKSEALIYNLLVYMRIAFVYEAPFYISEGIVLHPDFTIYKPWGNGDFLIEHDGLFMNRNRRSRTFIKMEQYYDAGLIFYEHILFTFDKADGTLDIASVEQLINVCLHIVTPPQRPSYR